MRQGVHLKVDRKSTSWRETVSTKGRHGVYKWTTGSLVEVGRGCPPEGDRVSIRRTQVVY